MASGTAWYVRNAGRMTAAIRRAQAVEMRLAGATFEQIARECGYSEKGGARKAVVSALQAHWDETAPDRQALLMRELATLDRLQMALWPTAMLGDPAAARSIVRIMERRARMTGIDAPTKIELTDEMDRAIKELGQQLAEDPTWDVDAIEGVDDTAPRVAIEGGPSGGDPD